MYVLVAGCSVIAPRGGAPSHLDEAWLGAGLIKELLKEQVRPEDLGGRLLRSITELCDHKAMASDHQIPALACGVLKPWLLDQMQAQEGSQGRFRVELMESFAAQAIANVEDLNLGAAEVNAWGGMLACGHPIGASGAVLAVRLFHRLS